MASSYLVIVAPPTPNAKRIMNNSNTTTTVLQQSEPVHTHVGLPKYTPLLATQAKRVDHPKPTILRKAPSLITCQGEEFDVKYILPIAQPKQCVIEDMTRGHIGCAECRTFQQPWWTWAHRVLDLDFAHLHRGIISSESL